ncbi:YfhO family protein, partial [Patescibacteria group bacterium]|nr:YfhO family protein [Patescibacteria group bacterium]
MSTKHFILFLLAALTVTVSPFIAGYYYGTGDTQDVYLPLEDFFRTEQLAGRLPLWHPDIAWGFPVLASAQIGFFYPPLLLLRLLPASIYFPLLFTLQIALAALSTFALARKLSLSRPASYLAAISFSHSAWLWQHATHLNIIITATWLPLQLLAAHHLASNGRAKAKSIAWLAIVLALPFLGGQMHLPVMSAAITASYLLYCYWRNHRQIMTPLALIAIVGLLALGLGAAQLLPTAELASLSSRTSEFSVTQANQYSFPFYHLPTTLFPRFFDSDNLYWGKRLEIEYGIFFGTIPLLLAFFAIRRARRRLPFFFYLGVISWLLALGSASPFRLIGLEPSFWIFSAPARWLLFTTLSGSLLAGLGFDLLIKQAAIFKRYLVVALVAVVLSSTLATALLLLLPTNAPEFIYQQITTYASRLLGEKPPTYYLDKITQVIASARSSSVSLLSFYTALPLGILLLSIITRAKKWWPVMLLSLTTIELVIIAGTANPLIPWSTITAVPASVAKLPPAVLQKQARLMTTTAAGDTGALLTNPATKADLVSRLNARE